MHWCRLRAKRHYLATVWCGVVRVEHRSTKTELGRNADPLWLRAFGCTFCCVGKYPNVDRELTSMATFDRFSIKVVAGVGLCGAAIALSQDAAAAPLKTGGYACMQGAAGEVAAPAVAGGAAACAPAAAPLAEMSGAPV